MVGRRKLLIWTLFCLTAGAVFLVYACASLAAGRGEFVLPLDDVYIHFQYAKQLAHGQPYVYNPGQSPTSGATSFLYPYVLAAGYLLGFQSLNLSLWAMIIGALSLLGSLWLVYRLLKIYDTPDWLAVMTALIFGLTGAVSWHFMSGMETDLMMLFTLATLYAVICRDVRSFALSASLLALTRPEGGILAVIAAGVMWVGIRRDRAQHVTEGNPGGTAPLHLSRHFLLFLPVLAVFVQPLVNQIVTGSAVATGNSVKSIFGLVPFYWDVVLGRIVDNFTRMWTEFLTGVSPREGLYLPYLIGPLALGYLVFGLFRRRTRLIHAMLVLWLLAGTAAIATLDTAFWHFKRYQMPLIVLLFPLMGWALNYVLVLLRTQRAASLQYVLRIVVGAGLVVALMSGVAFVQHFALNVDYVYLQPLQMARWLQANTPEDAVVAVHDVGMMRYVGDRTTLDIVGLTTPGAAAYWRNGPGSIAEFLMQHRPDYIASYGKGHGYGLGLIADTAIYANPLAEFPVDLDPNFNVALAADFQGIYQPNWDHIGFNLDKLSSDAALVDVANLDSEAAVHYEWTDRERLPGFPTDVQALKTVNCPADSCENIATMRMINGSESFTVPVEAGRSLLIGSIVHPAHHGTLDVYVNGVFVDRSWIPEIPGYWIWIPTYIPAEFITTGEAAIRIEVNVPGGYYMPALHVMTQNELHNVPPPEVPLASYQDGAFVLSAVRLEQERNRLRLNLDWYSMGGAEGDYRFFVHLYGSISQPPIAQTDTYPGAGMTPPGNWLPGANSDSVDVDLSDVPPGTYKLAIGFYDPYDGTRLIPQSDVYDVSPDGRLWLGEVEVPDEGA